MSREITYRVAAADDGRMIKYIVRGKIGLSHHQFSALKVCGGILLDGKSVHANEIVRDGQIVSVWMEDEAVKVALDDTPVNVVYEDDDIIIVDKDAPLATQSSTRQEGMTLENRMAYRYGREGGYVFRPINRLDKGTSGLMTVAKHPHAQKVLQTQLHTDDFVREYLAVVIGQLASDEGQIDAPIAKASGATVKREVNMAEGKRAVTQYRVMERGEENTLVRLRLLTGRTHQIRVHMSYIGHPVFGDFLYGQEDERLPRRFALHSAFLSLVHPVTGRHMAFESELPEKLRKLI